VKQKEREKKCFAATCQQLDVLLKKKRTDAEIIDIDDSGESSVRPNLSINQLVTISDQPHDHYSMESPAQMASSSTSTSTGITRFC